MHATATHITPEALAAEKLATAIEIISQDLRAPLDVSFRLDPQTEAVLNFTIGTLIPDATIPATAGAIANQLDHWSTRFTAVAAAIRQRFPTRI